MFSRRSQGAGGRQEGSCATGERRGRPLRHFHAGRHRHWPSARQRQVGHGDVRPGTLAVPRAQPRTSRHRPGTGHGRPGLDIRQVSGAEALGARAGCARNPAVPCPEIVNRPRRTCETAVSAAGRWGRPACRRILRRCGVPCVRSCRRAGPKGPDRRPGQGDPSPPSDREPQGSCRWQVLSPPILTMPGRSRRGAISRCPTGRYLCRRDPSSARAVVHGVRGAAPRHAGPSGITGCPRPGYLRRQSRSGRAACAAGRGLQDRPRSAD